VVPLSEVAIEHAEMRGMALENPIAILVARWCEPESLLGEVRGVSDIMSLTELLETRATAYSDIHQRRQAIEMARWAGSQATTAINERLDKILRPAKLLEEKLVYFSETIQSYTAFQMTLWTQSKCPQMTSRGLIEICDAILDFEPFGKAASEEIESEAVQL
jgi:hypothetical protein